MLSAYILSLDWPKCFHIENGLLAQKVQEGLMLSRLTLVVSPAVIFFQAVPQGPKKLSVGLYCFTLLLRLTGMPCILTLQGDIYEVHGQEPCLMELPMSPSLPTRPTTL